MDIKEIGANGSTSTRMTFSLYLVTNTVNGKQYVGITTKKVLRRWNSHVCSARTVLKKTILHRAICKYGQKAFLVEHIASSSSYDDLKGAEVIAIKQFGSKTPKGYNATSGGDGTLGYKPTPETLKKLSQSHIGFKHTDEAKKKISAANIARYDALGRLSGDKRKRYAKKNKYASKEEYRAALSRNIRKQLQDPQFAAYRDQTGRKRTTTSRAQMRESRRKLFERDPNAKAKPGKLTLQTAAEVKWLLQQGKLTQMQIAARYTIGQTQVSNIKHNLSWQTVQPVAPAEPV